MLLAIVLLACSGPDGAPHELEKPAPAPTPPPAVEPVVSSAFPTPAHAIAFEHNLRPMATAHTPALAAVAPAPSADGRLGPGPKAPFGLYMLALSWAPQFCSTHGGKEQCEGLDTAFAGNHFSLHGLWPQYTDAEGKQYGADYPVFCGQYSVCNTKGNANPACLPDPSSIPAQMATLGPGYVTDDNFLANHEWPKHGSCTGLASGPYFQAAINLLLALPGDQGTPAPVAAALGKEIALSDLLASFGDASAVVAACDSQCNLMQVGLCYAHDENNVPTTLAACPVAVLNSSYDDSCGAYAGRKGCASVKLMVPGAASGGGGSSGGGSSASGGTCENPGQGPACTSDAQCESQSFLRCAHSGCCTTVPK